MAVNMKGKSLASLYDLTREEIGQILKTSELLKLQNFRGEAHPLLKGKTLGIAAASIWFFENFFNIARYMADARRLQLPLVGGGDHDWNTIFMRWGVLQYDTRIASVVKVLGWVGIGATCAWVLWCAWRDRRPASPGSGEQLAA